MCTQAEKNKRIREVMKMICLGRSRAEIVGFMMETWGLKDAQIDRYITMATERLEELGKVTVETVRNECHARYNLCFEGALESEDYRGAADIQQKIGKLYGAEAPAKTELTGKGGAPVAFKIIIGSPDDETETMD